MSRFCRERAKGGKRRSCPLRCARRLPCALAWLVAAARDAAQAWKGTRGQNGVIPGRRTVGRVPGRRGGGRRGTQGGRRGEGGRRQDENAAADARRTSTASQLDVDPVARTQAAAAGVCPGPPRGDIRIGCPGPGNMKKTARLAAAPTAIRPRAKSPRHRHVPSLEQRWDESRERGRGRWINTDAGWESWVGAGFGRQGVEGSGRGLEEEGEPRGCGIGRASSSEGAPARRTI